MSEDYLLEKWLKNELTDAEKEAFSKLDDARFNQFIVDEAKNFKASEFYNVNDFNTFKNKYNSKKTLEKKVNWFKPFLKIASVLVVALGLYFTFIFNDTIRLETLASKKTTVELPDHSQVELNALSLIEYNSKTWSKNRDLYLKGEAFFKVAKGKTFKVKTNTGIITVVGTQFNVKQRNNYFEVICYEGVVNVKSGEFDRKLLAGDVFKILNGKFTEGKTDDLEPKWTHNLSQFKAIPFNEVLAELERQYNIEVTFKNIDVNRLFSGGFTHNNLENALIAITHPMGMTYELSSSNQVVIHGNKN